MQGTINPLVGTLKKMITEWHNPVSYYLSLSEKQILLNQFLGKKIFLDYLGTIHCIQCGRQTQKSFQQGFCFPCYRRLLECNLCIIHPEKCRYYQGICLPGDWAHAHCIQPHVVYLANSSGLKVGITRETQIPTRWIDQGATQGLVIFRVQNRYQAGLVETTIKQHMSDKTNWQIMLKSNNNPLPLFEKFVEIQSLIQAELEQLMQQYAGEIQRTGDVEEVMITYPVQHYPQKITVLNFDKTPHIEGILQGIKGQYLLLDTGVISIRKFAGYLIKFSE